MYDKYVRNRGRSPDRYRQYLSSSVTPEARSTTLQLYEFYHHRTKLPIMSQDLVVDCLSNKRSRQW